MRIDEVKQVVIAAHSCFQSLQEILNNKVENITLEEVERSEDNNFWLITLGFERPQKSDLRIPGIVSYEREYKVFKVNVRNKEVESIKVRVLRSR